MYESHLPEATALPGLPVTEGATVVRRERLSARHAFRVGAVADGLATLEPIGGGPEQCAPVGELIALQRFGEPIFPGLEKVSSRIGGLCADGVGSLAYGRAAVIRRRIAWARFKTAGASSVGQTPWSYRTAPSQRENRTSSARAL